MAGIFYSGTEQQKKGYVDAAAKEHRPSGHQAKAGRLFKSFQ